MRYSIVMEGLMKRFPAKAQGRKGKAQAKHSRISAVPVTSLLFASLLCAFAPLRELIFRQ
jgi:hypothetical protein